ncbi:PDZ domain-containing protein [Weissella beninensis]|uniref:PDZ domain-containing protein n=1 Tax=Periweissella beninensis TaxID=504936 RepID=A0ABT0VKC1_9LACO|nr:SepM family pheromone-processing serine protease [Periweissella beninensis]MBM7544204.1 PDZ domain-containing protein [Periweissella beninensis]MCM2437588.1 PDZ domain-containing protein [Periweissella beninensis]
MVKKHKLLRWAAFFLGMMFLIIICFKPLNYYIESPGGATNITPFVKINQQKKHKKGQFMITYVQLAQATPLSLILAKFKQQDTIYTTMQITGGANSKTYNRVQNFYMQNAIDEAIAVAYKAANKQVSAKYVGIFITSIAKKSYFSKQLRVGDTVTKINGHHFKNARGYQQYLAKKTVNSKVTVTYIRNNVTKVVTNKLINLGNSRAGLGISLADNVKVTTTPKISVNPGQIGGPSGGLMFSLEIYNQLINNNLKHNQKIAGTGTIDLAGNVGEIGGIDKKVIAANKAGAAIFFAPYVKPTKLNKMIDGGATNYQVAKKTIKKYHLKLKLVPVETFNDGINYLAKH